MTKRGMSKGFSRNQSRSQLVPLGFAGVGGQFAASLHPRFAPIGMAIGLARDAQICSQIDSLSSRDPVKYPGQAE
jgi:hypothetical protein